METKPQTIGGVGLRQFSTFTSRTPWRSWRRCHPNLAPLWSRASTPP